MWYPFKGMEEVDRKFWSGGAIGLGAFNTSTVDVETDMGILQLDLALWNPKNGAGDNTETFEGAHNVTGKRYAIGAFMNIFRSELEGHFSMYPTPTLHSLGDALKYAAPKGVFSEMLHEWFSFVPLSKLSTTDHRDLVNHNDYR